MNPGFDDPDERRLWLVRAAFVASAAGAAGVLRFAWKQPVAAAVVLGAMAMFVLGRWVAQRRLRRTLRSGDVFAVMARWSRVLDRLPHPATMGPLMTAMAFAACGWVDQARAAIAAAERGPAWDAALEHRLFLDTMLLTFEGDGEGALEQARRLGRLDAPRGDLGRRVLELRVAVNALARAFAHQSEQGDRDLLEQASETSPLVFWAMRYGAAVIAIDQGDDGHARSLIARAPPWPHESRFKEFHREIAERVGLR